MMPVLAKEIVVQGGRIEIDGAEFPWFISKGGITATHDRGLIEVTLTIPCERVEMGKK